jgi:hypothetical protein
MPRDSYRLHFSLSISDLLDEARSETIASRIRKLSLEKEVFREKLVKHSGEVSSHRQALKREISLASDELQLVSRLVDFYETKFAQGTVEFNTLARARLELLNVHRSLGRLSAQLHELEQ